MASLNQVSLNQADHDPEQLTPDSNEMWRNAYASASASAANPDNAATYEEGQLIGGRASRRRSYKKRRHAKRKSRKSRKSRS